MRQGESRVNGRGGTFAAQPPFPPSPNPSATTRARTFPLLIIKAWLSVAGMRSTLALTEKAWHIIRPTAGSWVM